MTIAITLGLLAVLMLLGVTVPVAIGASAIMYFFFLGSLPAKELVAQRINGVMDDYVLVAIALFVIYGRLCAVMSVRPRLVATLTSLLGGSSIAAKVAEILGSLLQPDTAGDALLNRNDEAAATVNRLRSAGVAGWAAIGQAAALGLLRTITPPGVLLVAVALQFDVPIVRLYAAMLPLVLLGSVVLLFIANLVPSDDALAPEAAAFDPGVLWWVVVPLAVLGTIYYGIVTATEAGAIAVALALALGLLERKLLARQLLRAGLDSLQDIGAIYLVIVFAVLLSTAFAYEQTSSTLMAAAAHLDGSILVGIAVMATIILCALTGALPTVFVAGALLAPVMVKLGVDPFRAAIIIVVATALGLLVPPIGPIFATLAIGTTERFGKVVLGIVLFSLVGVAMLALGWWGPLWELY